MRVDGIWCSNAFAGNAVAHLIVAGGAAPLVDGLARWRRRHLREQRALDQNERRKGNDGLKSVPADGQNSVPRGR